MNSQTEGSHSVHWRVLHMGVPFRFVAATLNLWATHRWPEREDALRAWVRAFGPDILCVQELRRETARCLDEELPGHRRIDDAFEGWHREGNIYWSDDLFEYVAHGCEDIGMLEPLRRLFWVRLRARWVGRTVLVSNAHYTFKGNRREVEEGLSPRIEQAQRTIRTLRSVAGKGEAVLFMGDLNDAVNPIRYLRKNGLTDSFTALGMPHIPTYPAIPTSGALTPQVYDWQLHCGPIRPLHTSVSDFFLGDMAPSDHKPVITTYELLSS